MTGDTDSLYEDTGLAPPPPPATDADLLLEELARTNQGLVNLRRTVFAGFNQLAGDLGAVEKKVQAFEARSVEDGLDRRSRQAHLDRLLWAALALAGAHLILDAARLWRWRQS